MYMHPSEATEAHPLATMDHQFCRHSFKGTYPSFGLLLPYPFVYQHGYSAIYLGSSAHDNPGH